MKNQIKIALICMEENDLGVTMDLICNYFATVNLMVNHVELGMNVKTTFAKMASALVMQVVSVTPVVNGITVSTINIAISTLDAALNAEQTYIAPKDVPIAMMDFATRMNFETKS